MSEMLSILKKLTVKEMNIDPSKLIANIAIGDVVVVGRIYGVAHKYKEAPSKFSTTDVPRTDYRFSGQFEGINLITGEVFNAPTCFLPGAAPEQLASALDAADGGSVEFGVEVAVKKVLKRDGTEGYQFGVAVPRQPQDADPLALMRERMASLPGAPAQALLEAPKTDDGKTSKKARKAD